MSTLRKMILGLGFMVAFFAFANSTAKAQGRNVSLQVFYDELSYHGDWIDNAEYGYVWRPNVGSDFRPYYTNGRWVMTQYGNTWVSDFEWGWAPFHYGRWYYDNYDGWLWIPDTEWGPAWVDWRTGGGYYGWAPMGPRITVSINIGPRYYPDFYWVFIPQRYIYYNNYGRYWNPGRNVTIIRNTTIINNVYVNNNVRYVSGPSTRDVRRATGSNVRVHRVESASRPGSARVDRNSVSVYRPQIDRGRDATPNRVSSSNNGRPSRTEGGNARDNRNNGNNRPQAIDGRSDRGNSSPGVSTRPSRIERDNGNVPSRGSNVGRSTTPDRSSRTESPQRENGSRDGMPSRTERPQQQRVERPGRIENRPSAERSESVRQSAPQRQERVQQSAPQRTERPSTPGVQRSEGRSSSPGMDRGSSRSSSPSRGSGSERPSR